MSNEVGKPPAKPSKTEMQSGTYAQTPKQYTYKQPGALLNTEQELIAQEVAPEIEKKVLQATDTVTVEAPPVK